MDPVTIDVSPWAADFGDVSRLRFDPTGERLAVGMGHVDRAVVLIVRTADGALLAEVELRSSDGAKVAWPKVLEFSPDGATLLAASLAGNGTLPGQPTMASGPWLIDTATGVVEPFATGLAVEVSFWSADWSPDGRRLTLGDDRRALTVWDVASRQQVTQYRGAAQACFTPDGIRLVAGRRGPVLVDVASGAVQQLRPSQASARLRPLGFVAADTVLMLSLTDKRPRWIDEVSLGVGAPVKWLPPTSLEGVKLDSLCDVLWTAPDASAVVWHRSLDTLHLQRRGAATTEVIWRPVEQPDAGLDRTLVEVSRDGTRVAYHRATAPHVPDPVVTVSATTLAAI